MQIALGIYSRFRLPLLRPPDTAITIALPHNVSDTVLREPCFVICCKIVGVQSTTLMALRRTA